MDVTRGGGGRGREARTRGRLTRCGFVWVLFFTKNVRAPKIDNGIRSAKHWVLREGILMVLCLMGKNPLFGKLSSRMRPARPRTREAMSRYLYALLLYATWPKTRCQDLPVLPSDLFRSDLSHCHWEGPIVLLTSPLLWILDVATATRGGAQNTIMEDRRFGNPTSRGPSLIEIALLV